MDEGSLYPNLMYPGQAFTKVPWTPAQKVLRRWYDALDAATIINGVGDGVATWVDKGDLGINATQTTAGNQPKTGTRDLNGRNTFDFDGLTQFFDMGTVDMIDSTVFIVAEVDNLAGFQNFMGHAIDNFQMRIDVTTGAITVASGNPYWGNPSTSTEVMVAGVPAIVGFVFDTSISHLLDGVRDDPATGNDGVGFTDYNVIGNRQGVDCFNGKISEIIIFDTVLDTDDIERVEGYIEHRYGLDNLGSGHTYKDEQPFV